MLRLLLKSKIHRVTVTGANLDYEGSLTVDEALLEAAGMVPYEMVKVYNVSNGARFDTYAVAGPRGSGEVILNGAAARKGAIGDLIIIAAYGVLGDGELGDHLPKIVRVDDKNRPLEG